MPKNNISYALHRRINSGSGVPDSIDMAYDDMFGAGNNSRAGDKIVEIDID